MPEQKEKKEVSETEGELKKASPQSGETPRIPPVDRAGYWFEQDPKYANG